jgi:signal transduction histidine kinase
MAQPLSAGADVLIERAMLVARDVCGLELAYISEFRDGTQIVRRKAGDDSGVDVPLDLPFPLEGTYCQAMVDGRMDSVIPDTNANPFTAGLPSTQAATLRSYVGVPVRLPDGRLYGTFCCVSSEVQPGLAARHAELLNVLATLVGDQIDQTERSSALERTHHEFLASVSHDLRTPLRAVTFLAEDLVAGHPDVPADRAGRLILQEAERVLRMIDDILLVTRQRVGDLRLEPRRADVRELLQQAARSSALAAGPDGERVVFDLPSEPVWADVDAGRVMQAVQNLTDNALKYSPEGGAVVVRAWREDTTVVLEVVDEGIGVAPEDLDRLGERFFRAGSAQSLGIPGIGLGLTTAQAVAVLHEGVMSATSTLGRGSSFRLRLPITRLTHG